MPKTAFIILKSPQEQDPTHAMRRFVDGHAPSAILLEDGVYQAVLPEAADKLGKAATDVLVSLEDLEARGLGAGDLKVGRTAGYPEVVDWIMERTERTITV